MIARPKLYLCIIVLTFFSFGKNTSAQSCPNPNVSVDLYGKNLKFNSGNGGSVFGINFNSFSGVVAPLAPAGLPEVSPIKNQFVWIGSQNSNDDLKLSVATYYENDFSASPAFIENNPPTFECLFYNQIWKVTGEEIALHLSDFNDNGTVDQPIENVYAYPGSQNPFFLDWNGFDLPNTTQEMAPFFDQNNDGIYNPAEGDFPLPEGVSEMNIPMEMAWSVSNDAQDNYEDSGVDSLMIELHSTMWSFFCEDDPLLDYSIFHSHKIINRGDELLDSVVVGYSARTNLGCQVDDFIGCIPEQNTYYHYNRDEFDGSVGCICSGGVATYCGSPPVQAISFLNREMSSFMFHYEDNNQGSPYSNRPELPFDFWNLMNSQWTGTPLTFGENGINPANPTTNFAFPDHPNDPQGWSMITSDSLLPASNTSAPLNSIASISIGDLAPGQSERIDMVYTFYSSDSLNNLESVNLVYENTPLLQQKHDNNYDLNCGVTVSTEDVFFEENEIQIFPNPTADILNIKMKNPSQASISIFDIYGKRVLEKMEVDQNEIQLSTSNFSKGIYFLKIEMEGKELVKKFIKM